MMTTRNDFDNAMEDVLWPVARPKRNNTAHANNANRLHRHRDATLMKRAARIAQRTPEVMVRITGATRGQRHMREHFNYVTRNGKLSAEDEQGDVIAGREAVRELADQWRHDIQGNWRRNSRDTINLVLSMPAGTDRDRLVDAARTFAVRNFGADRRYLFVRHDDTEHPHCHLTLRAVGYDGRHLNPRKADLQAWRESFAACLREQGIAAAASPRRARGVVRKGDRQAVHHAKREERSTVAKVKVDQAARRVASNDTAARPWEQAIQARQQRVRGGWLKAAAALENSGIPDATKLARQLRSFVRSMPAVQTEQQTLEARMREHIARQRQARRRDKNTSRGR